MKRQVILDTGPLVAFLNYRERHHDWATARFAEITPPLQTCEAVITEACHLVRHLPAGPQRVLDLVREGAVAITFQLNDHIERVHSLLDRYSDHRMSLADACIVRMSEVIPDSSVLTLDSDFRIYRRHGRQSIKLIIATQ